ncbi:hypothetical protein KIH74_18270 [Kineosporia sp. J2-2]|uniref:Integral membrane protein n=1 Tax=Kineosporia corallincola TaxID=2835133 RepID=A0ABS5TL52_9ACTN|nr:hypothetical protein [Kineosporia corallincola]MBT0770891.1 hypothetical protein [Kineosporia corallincola]
MTTTEWITDLALLLIVFRQLRESRLDAMSFLLPLGIIGFVAHRYLTTVPTDGNDLALVGTLVAVGAALGVGGGLCTRVRAVGEHVLVKAGAVAAVLWVLGMGARMTFQLWSEHGGAGTIARFSVTHDITSAQAWVAAFVLMALTEVVTRLATIFVRARLVRQAPAAARAYATTA